MRVVNEQLKASLRGPGRCEHCHKHCRVREAAHVFAKGMGAGKQLDIRINLLSVGSTLAFQCTCHTASHIDPEIDFLSVVAKRERELPGDIRDVIYWLRALPKNPSERQVEVSLMNWEFTSTGLALARRTWDEINE